MDRTRKGMTQRIEENLMPNWNNMANAVEQARNGVAQAIIARKTWNLQITKKY